MLDLPLNVRQELMSLVPASIIQNISCFSFININQTTENFVVDIVVCTTNGEIIEFYQRKPVQSFFLDNLQQAQNLTIYKNGDETNYLVSTNDELLIFNRKTSIELLKIIQNLRKFMIDDSSCLGNAKIKLWYKGDAMPVVLDEKFNIESETISPELFEICEDEEVPTLNKQKCKLIEARYVVSQSERNLNDIIDLRKKATFVLYSKMYPQLEDVLFKKPVKEVIGVLRKQIEREEIKVSNKKVIVIHNVYNDSNESLTDIETILHCKDKEALEYTTKIYNFDSTSVLYWTEKTKSVILPKEKAVIVTILDNKELENSSTHNIDFNGLILYKMQGNVQLLPIDPIIVTQNCMISNKFDVLSLNAFDERDLLAVLASSLKTELILTKYLENDICTEPLSDLLCTHLGMVRVNDKSNVVIHRGSPYHPLNGVMVICEDKHMNKINFKITVYSRCQSQVIALIHYIYDAVPHRIIITLPGTEINRNTDTGQVNETQNIVEFGTSLRDQMTFILKYYDDCILKMGKSNDERALNMLGNKIDILIDGKNNFDIFVSKLKDQIVNGLDFLRGNVVIKDDLYDDVMIIDD